MSLHHQSYFFNINLTITSIYSNGKEHALTIYHFSQRTVNDYEISYAYFLAFLCRYYIKLS